RPGREMGRDGARHRGSARWRDGEPGTGRCALPRLDRRLQVSAQRDHPQRTDADLRRRQDPQDHLARILLGRPREAGQLRIVARGNCLRTRETVTWCASFTARWTELVLTRHVAIAAAIAALLGPVTLAQAQDGERQELLRGGATKKGIYNIFGWDG